jgi:hypothetical protein
MFIQTSSINNTRVRMVESGADTGTFLGSIQVVSSGDTTEYSKITAVEGDTLKITYLDEVNTTGSSRTVTDTALVTEAIPTPTPSPTGSPGPSPTPGPSPIPTVTPPSGGVITGSVVDALTTLPIVGATISTDPVTETATTGPDGNYTILNVPAGDYTVTASATGYESSSLPVEGAVVTVVEGAVSPANFALVPALPTTPTPIVTPTPTPTPCVVESITVSPTSLKLKKKKSKTVTVTVGCPDETVTATTTKAGRKIISISPASRVTDASGEAKFRIKAKTKAGNAKVTLKAGSKTKSMTVRVR